MKVYRQIVLYLLALAWVQELYSQQKVQVDTLSIQEFLEWKFNDMYHGNANICKYPLKIDKSLFNCSLPEYKNGREIIYSLAQGIACKYIGSNDIKYIKKQVERVKNLNFENFNFLKRKFHIINCDTIKTEIVINKFSIPLFTIDRKTTILIYTDEISNTACESYKIELYKKDDKNKWNFFVQLFRFETD